jgi:hypothetical protein
MFDGKSLPVILNKHKSVKACQGKNLVSFAAAIIVEEKVFMGLLVGENLMKLYKAVDYF